MRTSMIPRHQRLEIRRAEGAKRNEAWAKLSSAQKLESLDRRLGVGVGAKRQRGKLS